MDKKNLIIKVKYMDEHAERIMFVGGAASNWIDLRAAEDVRINKGGFALIPLGVAMKLPDGYEAHVAPRSSTFIKWHIIQTNGVGVIDNSYSGDGDEWKMPVYATEDTFIKKGDRVCQFRIMPCMTSLGHINIETADHLDEVSRGGFGSTGTA